MSKYQIEIIQAEYCLDIAGQPRVVKPVKMARRPSDVPADWLRFQRLHVPGGSLTPQAAASLQLFMRSHRTEAVTDGVDCFTIAGDGLAYCDPTVVN